MNTPTRIMALISGGGRTALNILDAIAQGELNAKLELAIASRPDAAGVERLKRRGVPCRVVNQKDFRSDAGTDWRAMSATINELIQTRHPDLVILAGYMCLYYPPAGYEGRVMNIHPALIPAFCGRGMYGHHVHEAVVARGVKVSGCTVHFVDGEYDHGPIIVQRACPVYDTDTPDDVAERVFAEECRAYPEAIRLFSEGRLSIRDGRVCIAQ